MKESKIQFHLIKWRNENIPAHPELELLYAIPNGGYRLPVEAVNLKRAGVVSGMPDLHLPIARGGFHGLWIELKSQDGRLSKNQTTIHDKLKQYGHSVHVCYDTESAIQVISDYLYDKKEKEMGEEVENVCGC